MWDGPLTHLFLVLWSDLRSKKRRLGAAFTLVVQVLFLGLGAAGWRDDVIHPEVDDGLTVVIEWVSE